MPREPGRAGSHDAEQSFLEPCSKSKGRRSSSIGRRDRRSAREATVGVVVMVRDAESEHVLMVFVASDGRGGCRFSSARPGAGRVDRGHNGGRVMSVVARVFASVTAGSAGLVVVMRVGALKGERVGKLWLEGVRVRTLGRLGTRRRLRLRYINGFSGRGSTVGTVSEFLAELLEDLLPGLLQGGGTVLLRFHVSLKIGEERRTIRVG